MSFSDLPLRMALLWGFLFSFASFVVGVAAIVAKLAGAFVVPGWASIVVVVAFLGGMQLTVLGVIGEYIARIHEEVKQRPLYLLREQVGFETEDTAATRARSERALHARPPESATPVRG